MSVQVFPPHPKLAKYLLHTMVVDLDGIDTRSTAALSPCLMLMTRGSADVVLPDGSTQLAPRFVLRGPLLGPAHSRARQGSQSLCVLLRPGVLHLLMGIAPGAIVGRFVDMQEVAGLERVGAFFQAIDGASSAAECVDLFHAFLLDTVDHSKPLGIGAALVAAYQKMFMPLIDLALYFGIGQRQLERRVQEVFGMSLRDTRRITRFGLCLMRFIGHQTNWGDLTQLAHESGYYDQPHMHREFVELAGISPAQLIQKINSEDPSFWVYRIAPDQAHRLFMPVD